MSVNRNLRFEVVIEKQILLNKTIARFAISGTGTNTSDKRETERDALEDDVKAKSNRKREPRVFVGNVLVYQFKM